MDDLKESICKAVKRSNTEVLVAELCTAQDIYIYIYTKEQLQALGWEKIVELV